MSLPSLTEQEKDLIKDLHNIGESLVDIIDKMEYHRRSIKENPTQYNKAVGSLQKCIQTLEQLEFAMQSLWGFEQNELKHTWWLYPNTCTCPKLDNRDPAFFGRGRIIVEDCPLHNPSNLSPIA